MLRSIKLEKNQRKGILDKLKAEIKIDTPYLGLAVISSFIATFALLIEDLPILIGAMLIAPFLTAPLSIGMSLIKGDLELLKKGLITLLFGVVAGILAAILIGLFSPFKIIGDEILNRSAPTLVQLIIAVLAGGAAAFSYAHRKIRAVLSGAFVALALVPPISIIGIGIAFWNWEIVGGASLLLVANIIGLVLAAVIIFFLLGFRPINRTENLHEVRVGITWLALLFFIIALPLGYIMNNIIAKIKQEQTAQRIVSQQMAKYPDTFVDHLACSKAGDKLKISFTIYSPQQIDTALIRDIRDRLEKKLANKIEIDAKLVPTFKIDY
jgi:uncharacterized hydrophobic protein (TIGR00271 family)